MTRVLSALALTVILALPGITHAQHFATPGYLDNYNAYLRTGPGTNYDSIALVYANRYFDVLGCLQDWSWCDVTAGDYRGWLPASQITMMPQPPASMRTYRHGVPVVTFNQNTYWYSFYRNTDFYDNWVHSNVKRKHRNDWNNYPYRSGGYYPRPPKPTKPYTEQPSYLDPNIPPKASKPAIEQPATNALEMKMKENQQIIRDNLNNALNK